MMCRTPPREAASTNVRWTSRRSFDSVAETNISTSAPRSATSPAAPSVKSQARTSAAHSGARVGSRASSTGSRSATPSATRRPSDPVTPVTATVSRSAIAGSQAERPRASRALQWKQEGLASIQVASPCAEVRDWGMVDRPPEGPMTSATLLPFRPTRSGRRSRRPGEANAPVTGMRRHQGVSYGRTPSRLAARGSQDPRFVTIRW